MDAKTIGSRVRKILEKQLKARGLRLRVNDNDSIITVGALDSLSAIELVAALEKTFGITVLAEEMTESNFDSISKISNFTKAKIGGEK
jgi:acyl carrier protein